MNFKVHTDGIEKMRYAFVLATSKAEKALAVQAMKDTAPYVPMRTGTLSKLARVQGRCVVYPGPYARYLYEGKYMVTENGKGPMHFTDKNGNEVIRYPYGSHLHATDRDLVYTKSFHSQAQAHWFQASAKDNMEKWQRVVGKAVQHEFKP